MSEIKFRAWAMNVKKMYYDSFTITPEGKIAATYGIYDKALELMQYTGLKDKNGKEIYEGDIIKYHDSMSFADNDPEGDVIDEVIFSFYHLSWEGRQQSDPLCDIEEPEVIGNIHESLELLKEEG